MWRPSISNGSLVWSAPADEAALREVVAVKRARDHAGRAVEAEVGLQPLGEPGAARPDADEAAVGLQQAAHAGEELRVERFGVEVVEHAHRSSRRAGRRERAEMLLEDDRRRRRVEVARRPRDFAAVVV